MYREHCLQQLELLNRVGHPTCPHQTFPTLEMRKTNLPLRPNSDDIAWKSQTFSIAVHGIWWDQCLIAVVGSEERSADGEFVEGCCCIEHVEDSDDLFESPDSLW